MSTSRHVMSASRDEDIHQHDLGYSRSSPVEASTISCAAGPNTSSMVHNCTYILGDPVLRASARGCRGIFIDRSSSEIVHQHPRAAEVEERGPYPIR